MEKRSFRDILTCLSLPSGDVPLAYMLKGQYMKYLHAFELKAKDTLMKQWEKKPNLTIPTTLSKTQPPTAPSVTKPLQQESEVPTIALNDSLQPELKPPSSQPPQIQATSTSTATTSQTTWSNNFPVTSTGMASAAASVNSLPPNSMVSNPMNPRMYMNQSPMNSFNQQNPYAGNQEMPPGYPGYGNYQNPMFQRPGGPMQNFNAMRPGMNNESMGGGWPRGFSPRQGPPELFPEGLQRMPWNQATSQRHPMSAFATQNFQSNQTRGQMPPITRDSLEQMKYNAQQQLKLQQFRQQQQQVQQQQQQQQQQQAQQQQQQQHQLPPQQLPHPQTQPYPKRFNSPASKALHKSGKMNAPDVKSQLTPTHSLKREFNFPPDSVEATKPVLKKRKKLTSKDLGKFSICLYLFPSIL